MLSARKSPARKSPARNTRRGQPLTDAGDGPEWPPVSPPRAMTRCESIAEHVIDIVGLKSNSSSSSDTWLIVMYDWRTRRVLPAFMKLFMYIPPEYNARESEALAYEMRVYRDVVKPIVDHGISPHFVYTYEVSNSCTFDVLASILANSRTIKALASAKRGGVSREKLAADLLLRNLLITQSNLFGAWQKGVRRLKRPAITNPIPTLESIQKNINERRMPNVDYDTAEFGYILNESMGETKTVDSWLQHSRPVIELLVMCFQVVSALNALAYSKCSHNDTHLANIYIERLDQAHVFEYHTEYDSESPLNCFVKTDMNVKLYDFDQAYAKRLGPNKFIDPLCRAAKVCNRFFDNRDTTKFASCLFARLADVYDYPMFESNPDADSDSERDEARRAMNARKFPKTQIPPVVHMLMQFFADKGSETKRELKIKTNKLMSAFMSGIFLTRVAVMPEDYLNPLNEIGLRDLPSPARVMANIARAISQLEERVPTPQRMLSMHKSIWSVPASLVVVSDCTRRRFDPETGEILAVREDLA